MICYAPNPFNLRKNVVLFYGCHKTGQFILDDYMGSDRFRRELIEIKRRRTAASSDYGQIVVSTHVDPAQVAHIRDRDFNLPVHATSNRPVFPIAARQASGHRIVDAKVAAKSSIVDISLVLELRGICEDEIKKVLEREDAFVSEDYFEWNSQDVGLHVTLFEFAFHFGGDKIDTARGIFGAMSRRLKEELSDIRSSYVELVGCEVTESTVMTYADFPSNFIDGVQQRCDKVSKSLASDDGIVNLRRVPFPIHCSLVRFGRNPSNRKKRIDEVAARFRRRSFGIHGVSELSLLLASRQPYDGVDERVTIALERRDEEGIAVVVSGED